MTDGIAISAGVRNNLATLQSTQELLSQTQNRLATGRSVNSALDDPTAFFAAQGLTNRADDLDRLLDGIGQSIQTLQAADDGLTSLSSLIEQAQTIAETARDESSGAAVVTSGNIVEADQNQLTANANIDAGDSFTLQAGADSPVTEFTIGADSTLADVVNQINATAGFSAQIVDGDGAGADSDRRLEIRTTNGEDLISAEGTGTPLADLGLAVGTTAAVGESPENRVQLESDFNAIRDQIDQLVGDTSFRGTNLLSGDSLDVQFNEDNTSNLTISGVDFDADGLGVGTADFGSDASIQTSLDEISDALNSVRAQASTFGQNLATIEVREDFTENTINNLIEGSDRLTLADLNEESANLLALQTQQSLAVTSLSLANQSQQSILQLF